MESVCTTRIVSFWQNIKLSLMDVPLLETQKISLRWCGVRIAIATMDIDIALISMKQYWMMTFAVMAKGEKTMKNDVCDYACDLNYEAEYNRLFEENEKLKAECRYFQDLYKEEEQRCRRMRGALRAVEVIFGRKFDEID